MASISASGTGCAAPIGGSALSTGSPHARRRWRSALVLPALLLAAAAPTPDAATAELVVNVEGLRSERGVVKYCLTRDAGNFPDCEDDGEAIWRTTSAADPALRITGLPQGVYAVSVIHDENRNDKLDTFAGIPREGFGFSNNPRIGFGPPKFAAARFALDRPSLTQRVRMRYFL